MSDLVDYLRHRLAVEAAGPHCSCPDVDVSDMEDLRRGERSFVKGYDERCLVHGFEGTEPVYRKRYAS